MIVQEFQQNTNAECRGELHVYLYHKNKYTIELVAVVFSYHAILMLTRWAFIAIVIAMIIIVIIWMVVPTLAIETTGTTHGIRQKAPHQWSRMNILQLQIKYAVTLNLSPLDLFKSMVVAVHPHGLSGQTTSLARHKAMMHWPATRIARMINDVQPRILLMTATAALQLTRLKGMNCVRHRPKTMVLFGDWLHANEWKRICQAWTPTRVEQMYAATECPLIALRSRKDGMYRLCANVELESTGSHTVRVKGFPDYQWHTLTDGIKIGDGFEILNDFRRNRYPWIKIGLDLQDRGIIDCFQMQRIGEKKANIAYVGNTENMATVIGDFEKKLGNDWVVTATCGEETFALPLRLSKCVGYVDLRTKIDMHL